MSQYWGIYVFKYYILEYINVEVTSCHSIRANICFIQYILKYITVEVASCHSNKGNNYSHKLYFRIY